MHRSYYQSSIEPYNSYDTTNSKAAFEHYNSAGRESYYMSRISDIDHHIYDINDKIDMLERMLMSNKVDHPESNSDLNVAKKEKSLSSCMKLARSPFFEIFRRPSIR